MLTQEQAKLLIGKIKHFANSEYQAGLQQVSQTSTSETRKKAEIDSSELWGEIVKFIEENTEPIKPPQPEEKKLVRRSTKVPLDQKGA